MLSDILTGLIGIAIVAFGGQGIRALAGLIKNFDLAKKLKLDALIDKAAGVAIHAVEQWGRTLSSKPESAKKLEKALEAMDVELSRLRIKLTPEEKKARIEALLNKCKSEVEHKDAPTG